MFCKLLSFNCWLIWLNAGYWKSSFQGNSFAKSSLCLRVQTQSTNIFWGIASSYAVFSIPYLSLFLSKIQKNYFHRSDNSCQSVSKFQLVKASSKLIQQLFYLSTGLLMELIWTGIPNTAVTTEIFLLQCVSPTVQKHPLRYYKIKPA